MPTTINGVGTHYYGKRNVVVRSGVCQSCGRAGNLKSYDTTYWFVVLFVPVLPLGRKRIFDQCPSCRRHYQASAEKFTQAQKQSVAEAREQFRAAPTAEAALDVHGQMLSVQAIEQARAFRVEILSQFAQDAELRIKLAQQLERLGVEKAATPLFERAFELNPKLPEAREALAVRRIKQGSLVEANALLDFLEVPGAGRTHSLASLRQLAEQYQRVGQHEDALRLCSILLREKPELAQSGAMRRFIWKSEKAAHRPTSLISQKKSSWLGIFNSRNAEFSERQRLAVFVGLILFLSVIGLGSLNEYIRRHRTVYVRNEFAPLAKVIIDGKIQIPDRASSNIELPEGVHHVNVTGTINEEFDVNLHANYFQRWTYSPAWVVNVGGATPMSVERVHYAAVPQPSESAVSVGEHLLFAPHVDYLFTPAPRTLKVEGGSKQVTKQNLIVLTEPAVELFDFAMEHSEREDAIRFAQSRLLLNPADDGLLYAYASAAEPGLEVEDLKAFLNGQLSRRPVLVSWHRCFQELHKGVAGKKSLIPAYDALLAKEPANGALLYLRGRLDPSPAEARRYHHRAMEADPTLGWPWMALAFDAASRAEWGACKEFAAGARDRGLTDEV